MCSISAGDKVIGTIYKKLLSRARLALKFLQLLYVLAPLIYINSLRKFFHEEKANMSSNENNSNIFNFYEKQRNSSLRDELTPLLTFENTSRRLENAHDLALDTEHFVY